MINPMKNEPSDAPNDAPEADETPFANRIYRVLLNDFHPGEYTGWDGLPSYDTTPRHAGPSSAHGASIEFYEFDPDLDENSLEATEAGMEDTDYWILTGTFDQLLACFDDLTPRLATVIYGWYGLGGDDNCYDYWPNSMLLASNFLDKLAMILAGAEINPTTEWAARKLNYARDDLNRIYWLARTRYARQCDPTPPETYRQMLKESHQYFNTDILNSDPFGACPDWLQELD